MKILVDLCHARQDIGLPGGGNGPQLMLATSKGSSPTDMNQISFLCNFSGRIRFPKFRVEISQILESSSHGIPKCHPKKSIFEVFRSTLKAVYIARIFSGMLKTCSFRFHKQFQTIRVLVCKVKQSIFRSGKRSFQVP